MSQPKVAQKRHTGKTKSQNVSHQLTPDVIGGERVRVLKPTIEREKGIEIRIRVALACAGVMVMKHHVDNRGHHRTGLGLGVADLICVVPPYGRFVGIEVKRPGYTDSDVRPEQKRWLAVVRRFGGVTGVASSVEEAMAIIREAKALPAVAVTP